MQLREESNVQPREDDHSVSRREAALAQHLQPRVLKTDGEDGVGDVPVLVGIGEAQLLRGPHGKSVERGLSHGRSPCWDFMSSVDEP